MFVTDTYYIDPIHLRNMLVLAENDIYEATMLLHRCLSQGDYDIRSFFKHGHVYPKDRPYLPSIDLHTETSQVYFMVVNDLCMSNEACLAVATHYFKEVCLPINSCLKGSDKVILFNAKTFYKRHQLLSVNQATKQLQLEYRKLLKNRALILRNNLKIQKDMRACYIQLQNIHDEHHGNCTDRAKISIFIHWNLPSDINKLIFDYGLESSCNHLSHEVMIHHDVSHYLLLYNKNKATIAHINKQIKNTLSLPMLRCGLTSGTSHYGQ